MKFQKQNKLILLLIILQLSFGFNCQSLAGSYSDIQQKTTQSATIRRKAIDPAKYEISSDDFQKKAEENDTFGESLKKMIRALLLAIALFCALVAYIVKNKEKFANINTLKKTNQKTETQTQLNTQSPPKEINPYEAKIRDLTFKFFKINK